MNKQAREFSYPVTAQRAAGLFGLNLLLSSLLLTPVAGWN